jgi:hypothetical protein
MITDRDMKTEIRHTLNDLVLDLDTITQAVYEDIHDQYGLITINSIGDTEYWRIVYRHLK